MTRTKQHTSWRVPTTTLFLIALWVMRAFSEGTQYITLLLPIREKQTTTVPKPKQQPKLQIKSVNRFSISQQSPQNNWRWLGLLGWLGLGWLGQGLGSDSSLVGCDISLETNSVCRTGTDWSRNSGTDILISLASFCPLSWALIKWSAWTYLLLCPVFAN